MRKSHKDLYIFVVGPKPEIVEKFRADVKDAVVIIPQAADDKVMQRIAAELAHEICQSKRERELIICNHFGSTINTTNVRHGMTC